MRKNISFFQGTLTKQWVNSLHQNSNQNMVVCSCSLTALGQSEHLLTVSKPYSPLPIVWLLEGFAVNSLKSPKKALNSHELVLVHHRQLSIFFSAPEINEHTGITKYQAEITQGLLIPMILSRLTRTPPWAGF